MNTVTLLTCRFFLPLFLCVNFYLLPRYDPFLVPETPPETRITAHSLHLKNGIIKLIGNVKAVRETDTLTCEIAFMNQKPLWILASQTPRLYRKERVEPKKATRETFLDALSILYFDHGSVASGAYPHDGVYTPEKPWMAHVFGGSPVPSLKFDIASGPVSISGEFASKSALIISPAGRILGVFPFGAGRLSEPSALSALPDEEKAELEASGSVTVKIEERTWDLATYSWLIISSATMRGYKNPNRMKFFGNVRIKDKDHFGQGNRLDYDKASSTIRLSGNAYIETERWSEKDKKNVKDVLIGENVLYDLNTKITTSE